MKNNVYWIHFGRIEIPKRDEQSVMSVTLTTDKNFIHVEDWADAFVSENPEWELTTIEKLYAYRDMVKEVDVTLV